MISIVVGAGFGDEGKGSVVNQLITDPNTIIVRFNGGHQVGHTVVENGIRHVFSNFGSGSLRGIPTFWSEFCTIHPLGIINEYNFLDEKCIKPKLYIDPLCPVVTPFDIAANKQKEKISNHGSVGVGFGTTVQRNTESPYKLYAQDLLNKDILSHKLQMISYYYGNDMCLTSINEKIMDEFMDDVEVLKSINDIHICKPNIYDYKDIIFEGGQGILLDQDFGFFPHVTRSNTTSKNAVELIKRWNLENEIISVIYVSRPYLTRHGNGPLPFVNIPININKNPNETNISHEWQGEFRYAPLNINLLNHSISCDKIYSNDLRNVDHHLYITCVDQLTGNLIYVENGELKNNKLSDIKSNIKVDNIIEKCKE